MPRDSVEVGAGRVAVRDRSDLRATWEAAFGAPPPRHLSMQVMQKALEYDRQCRRFGGLSAATRRQLTAAIQGDDAAASETASDQGAAAVALTPGAQLVREWNGRTYRVEVTEEGFRIDGTAYASLSAIARWITGTNWSGPRFFGLTQKRRA